MAKDQEGYLDPGILTRSGAGADLVDKTMDALLVRYNNIPIQNLQHFRRATPAGGTYQESTVSNTLTQPRLNEDTDALPWATVVPGFRKSFTMSKLRLGVRVTRTMKERDLKSQVDYMLSGLMSSAQRQLEFAASGIFNNGFTGDGGADGKDFIDSSRPFEDKTVTSTWSNKETAGALTHTSFSTARTAMRQRTNDRNRIAPVTVRLLMVPSDIEEEAKIIKATEKVSGSVLNDKNVISKGWDVMVNDYLTDTNAWFLKGDIAPEQDGLVYVEEVAPNIASWNPENVDILAAARLRMSYAIGVTVSKNWQGNEGA